MNGGEASSGTEQVQSVCEVYLATEKHQGEIGAHRPERGGVGDFWEGAVNL